MKATNISLYLLTCPNDQEADIIAQDLLDNQLVSCTKKLNVSSKFRWKAQIDTAQEVLLLLESKTEKFNQIESKVRELHSDETFVLFSIPVDQTTAGVTQWINEEVK